MSKNPFRSRQVPEALVSEFNARKDGSKLLQWTAKRFPWIHVLSCSRACSPNYNSLGNGKAISLFGINSSSAAYDVATKMPLPVVTGLDIKAVGSLGTTRKAVVKLQCFTDDQLVELQKCYFIPGMDVRVQWGWSVSCDGSSPPELLLNTGTETAKAVCQINKRRKDNSNYDGFQGIVANFKYSLTKDNLWDCEIEVISAADPFTESNVGNTSCSCPREVEVDEGEAVKDFGPIYAALSDVYAEGKKATDRLKQQLSKNTKDTTHHHFASWKYEGNERTELGADADGSFWRGLFTGEKTTEYWMSFGAFVDMLNMMSIPNNGNGEYPLGKIDINDVKLSISEKYAMSADPRVCYIPGGELKNSDFMNRSYFGGNAPSAITTEEGTRKVILANIMCNTQFLLKHYKQAYDGDGKLKTCVDNVLQEINRVCGRPWTLVTISTEEDCDADPDKTGPTITILDEKQAMKSDRPFEIPSKVGDSTLRDFSLDLKMTGAMKTQALYAGNSQRANGGTQDDNAACAGAAVRAFYVGGDISNRAKPSPGRLKTNCDYCEDSDRQAEPPTFKRLIKDFKKEVNDQSVGAMLAFLERETSTYEPKQCAGRMLPFDFNFTVDGIGGFEFGQMVTSNRIPETVRENFRFQLTKVEHTITANDWTTTVSTIARANPNGKQTDGGQAQS